MCKWMVLFLALLPLWAGATMGGNSYAATRYFTVSLPNSEFFIEGRRPTLHERAYEVTGHWRLFLQAYRAIEYNPAHRGRFIRKKPTIEGNYDGHRSVINEFARLGVTEREITRQPTAVYTLQLYTFRNSQHLQRFLNRMPRRWDSLYTGIYDRIPKGFHLAYDDESLRYKLDDLYILQYGHFTRVRYGVYENVADAKLDAAQWLQRFQVRAIVVRVPLQPSLTYAVIWGELPGIFRRET
ncbi:MAG TPA: hypothetical protein VHV83_14585 [Armatimonadota bacterium]|nr:hypothetical protein [Armatimonadota bacterium]